MGSILPEANCCPCLNIPVSWRELCQEICHTFALRLLSLIRLSAAMQFDHFELLLANVVMNSYEKIWLIQLFLISEIRNMKPFFPFIIWLQRSLAGNEMLSRQFFFFKEVTCIYVPFDFSINSLVKYLTKFYFMNCHNPFKQVS